MHRRRQIRRVFFSVVGSLFLSIPVYGDSGCYDCHGTRIPPDVRPLDDSIRNPQTGGFPGNHRSHLGGAGSTATCVKCHPGSNSYTAGHRDGMIKVSANINASAIRAVYRNATSAFPQTSQPQLGSCSNVNCHFERETPVWGSTAFAYPGDCGACHGAPPTGADSGAAGSHRIHDLYYPGPANCGVCHDTHVSFAHATSAGRALVVLPRHASDPAPGTYNGPLRDYFPRSQTNVFGSCATFYCHSDGTSVATGTTGTVTTAPWGSSLGCGGCHGFPPSYSSGAPKANSHGKHPADCSICHAATTADGTTITSRASHVDRSYTIAPRPGTVFSYSYASTGGSCSDISCHGDGTAVVTGSAATNSATWGGAEFSCASCHGYPPGYASGTPKTNSHVPHGNYNCSLCHAATTTNGKSLTAGGNHSNNAYDVIAGTGISFSYVFAPTGGTCSGISCHSGGTASWGGTMSCSECHSTYEQPPHFNSISTGVYPASYVTANVTCAACHTLHADTANRLARQQWAATGKGSITSPSWRGQDFKMKGAASPVSPGTSYAATDCVRCHTTTGFVNYVTDSDGRGTFVNISPWGSASDKTKEVLACSGCHVMPFDASATRRTVGRPDSFDPTIINVVTWYSYSTIGGKDRIGRKFADRRDSNVCIPCHTGKVLGQNIKNLSGKIDWSNTPFIAPHHMPAATVLFQGNAGDKIAGYEFRTASSYTDNYSHQGLDATAQGACVNCHMTSPRKHSFTVVSSAANGVIQRVTAGSCFESGSIGGCHTSSLDGTFMEGRRQGFLAALNVVASLLETKKGIFYNVTKYPYFFTSSSSTVPATNWGSAATMGAAFNLRLFQEEMGAWTHNPRHTMQLLYDTVDYLDDGVQNNTVNGTLQGMTIDPGVVARAGGYLLVNGGRP